MKCSTVFLCIWSFICLPSVKAQNPCTMADFLLGVAYHADKSDCSRYIQCDGLTNHSMQCGFGTLWDESVKACIGSRDTDCGLCSGESDGVQLPYDLYCNSYWQCEGGIPQARCCPGNSTFNGSSCVSGVCDDPCPVTPASPAPCTFSDSPDGPQYYVEDVPVWGPTRRKCPPGTNFNLTTCGCHDFVQATSADCPPKIDITYNPDTSSFVDNSINKAWIAINSVTLGNEPVFTGSSGLVIFLLAGATYGSSLKVSMVFSFDQQTEETNQTQILLQNGLCDEDPSFLVFAQESSFNSSLMDVTFTLATGGGDAATVTSDPNTVTATVPKGQKVRMSFDFPTSDYSEFYSLGVEPVDSSGEVVYLTVPMPNDTTIPRKFGALQIGNGDCSGLGGYTGFVGSIFQTTISSCESL